MSRFARSLAAVILFACALVARADALRLLAPAQDSALRGGSFAELRWSAVRLPAEAEEWEAFLSLDGGKYYAYRVTPHLEIERQRFTFVVPNVETSHARILIRVGDEVRETQYEARGTFTIHANPKADLGLPRLLGLDRGEAARAGDPGVLGWVEGPRDGSGSTWNTSSGASSPTMERHIRIATGPPAEDAFDGDDGVVAPRIAGTLQQARARQHRVREKQPRSEDLLLVCRRRNI